MQFYFYEESLRYAKEDYGTVYEYGSGVFGLKKLNREIDRKYFFKKKKRISLRNLTDRIQMQAFLETGETNYYQSATFIAIMLKESLLYDFNEDLKKLISDYCYDGKVDYYATYKNYNMFHHMKDYASCYPETLFKLVGKLKLSKNIGFPLFLWYERVPYWCLYKKRPNETGTALEICTREESDKASGDWLSPEDHARIEEQIIKEKLMANEMRSKGYTTDEIWDLFHYMEDKGII